MSTDNLDLETLCNDGERLIPFITHDDDEVIRHFSSHLFFKKIIEKDSIYFSNKTNFRVLDLGFGTGYASCIYANIDSVNKVTAIDVSENLLEWAKENYYNKKIEYKIKDAKIFLNSDKKYDYIITRHVLEHIEGGLSFIEENNYNNRLMINVPYKEPKGNPHHVITGITEKHFPKYSNIEFFYEYIGGKTYINRPDGVFINSIICIASKGDLPKVSEYFNFPVKATTVLEAYESISDSNFNLANNIVKKQIERGLNYPIKQNNIEKIVSRASILEKDNIALRKNVELLQKKIESIYNSKKWRYATKAAGVIRGFIGNEKNK